DACPRAHLLDASSAREWAAWNSSPRKIQPILETITVHPCAQSQGCCRPWLGGARGVSAAPRASRTCRLVPGSAHPFCHGIASTRIAFHRVCTKLHHVYSVVPFLTSCLKLARNGSRSDFKNRMFRPMTRRWGICLRSAQRYTV